MVRLNLVFPIVILWCEISKADFQSDLAAVAENTLPEDGIMNFTELSKKYGFKAEEYDIVTEDGYILTTFRIPGKTPVLLFHGLLDSADTFIIRGQNSLAATLANQGYDVWVANNRGNKYARRHAKLDPDKDMEFWDYSFHEIGLYDLAATIDFICNETGETSIAVIGHSQGTTAQYVLTSLRQEYNNKIKISIALAPGAFYNNPVFPVTFLVSIGPVLDSLVPDNIQEIARNHDMISNLVKFACSKGVISYIICGYGLIFSFSGLNQAGLESEFLPVVMGHFPSAGSRKNLMHYDQVFLRRSFSQYDYGATRNLAKYNTVKPPEYNLTAVTMPAALIAGNNDHFVTMKDVIHLKNVLPNVVHYEVMEPEMWNHLDFVWGSQMPKYLFPSILKILEKYTLHNRSQPKLDIMENIDVSDNLIDKSRRSVYDGFKHNGDNNVKKSNTGMTTIGSIERIIMNSFSTRRRRVSNWHHGFQIGRPT